MKAAALMSNILKSLCAIVCLSGLGCNAETTPVAKRPASAGVEKATPVVLSPVANQLADAAAEKPRVMKLGGEAKPKKPKTETKAAAPKKVMKLGGDSKAKPTAGKDAPDRAVEVKRLVDNYHGIAIRYAEKLALAKTPEEKEAAQVHEPSVGSLRSIARLLSEVVAADPTDTPSLDAMTFLVKFVGVPEIDAIFEKAPIDLMALLAEHHANDPKVVDAFRRAPRGEATDEMLKRLFETSFNPDVRWSSGAQLISSLRRNGKKDAMKEIVVAMAGDRYLEGVTIGGMSGSSNARAWAQNKIRELELLNVGQVLPAVGGEKLAGGTASISDYRGKVTVLDIWTTYCAPCVRMIPHQVEMVERLKDKPFALISVSCDRERDSLDAFLKETEMPWDHWWVGRDGDIVKTLNINAFPTIYVLDHKGVIRHKGIRGEELDAAVDKLLAEVDE